MDSSTRQTGVTTQQMSEAPKGAIFVWCNNRLDYPKNLARHLDRSDLRIKPLEWLRWPNVAGCTEPVIVDHAAYPDREALYALEIIRRRGNNESKNN